MTEALMVLCGGLGAVARFVVDGELRTRLRTGLPLPTLLVNLAGSLLLGLLAGLVARGGLSPDLRLVLGTGFCGGFTTFSTAMVEAVRLAAARGARRALAWVVGSSTLCVLAATLGWLLA